MSVDKIVFTCDSPGCCESKDDVQRYYFRCGLSEDRNGVPRYVKLYVDLCSYHARALLCDVMGSLSLDKKLESLRISRLSHAVRYGIWSGMSDVVIGSHDGPGKDYEGNAYK